MTALVTTNGAQLAAPRLEFTGEQRQMIRDMFANGASDDEFQVLMEIAKARGLNPLLRQVFFLKRYDSEKRREVWAAQVSIDGLRSIAERTGNCDGQDEPEFEYDAEGRLKLARVRVYHKRKSRPSVGVAHMSEYAQTKREGGYTKMWSEKPHIMLAKCAEALAIRKAFPDDTSGLYVPEEMGSGYEEPRAVDAEVVKVQSKALPAAPREPLDDAAATIAAYRARIAEATSSEQLKALGAEIKQAGKAIGDAVRKDYTTRAAAVKAAEKAEEEAKALIKREFGEDVAEREPGEEG